MISLGVAGFFIKIETSKIQNLEIENAKLDTENKNLLEQVAFIDAQQEDLSEERDSLDTEIGITETEIGNIIEDKNNFWDQFALMQPSEKDDLFILLINERN